MRVKANFYIIYDVDPENYEGMTDLREMVQSDKEAKYFDWEELTLIDAQPYSEDDDWERNEHEVRVQAAQLQQEL